MLRKIVLNTIRGTPLLVPVFRAYERLRAWDPRIRMRNAELRREGYDDGLPLPPTRLVVLVAGNPSLEAFLQRGEESAGDIVNILEKNQLALERFKSILDFGCGCGRVLRFWRRLTETEVHGCDYNKELVGWCQKNLPFANFAVNQLTPPLPYADASFDFIYALSVFTHLSEPLQWQWRDELKRVLRPGGYLLFSTHGEAALHKLSSEDRRQYGVGELVVQYGIASGTNMCAAFHPHEYIRNTLAQGFKVIDIVAKGARGNVGQDLVLFRKA